MAAEDDTGQGLDPNKIAELGDAMAYLNQALGSFGVNLSWAAAGTTADVTIHFAATTPEGGAADGVLGYTTPQNDVYFVTGWNYSTSPDPSQVAPDQFDFLTLAIHELGHTIGLGESQDPNSVMYEYLSPGTVRRTFTDSNLSLIDTDADRFMKVAEVLPPPSGCASPDVRRPPDAVPRRLPCLSSTVGAPRNPRGPHPASVDRSPAASMPRKATRLEVVASQHRANAPIASPPIGPGDVRIDPGSLRTS